jgi:hypothetical protein
MGGTYIEEERDVKYVQKILDVKPKKKKQFEKTWHGWKDINITNVKEVNYEVVNRINLAQVMDL